jgi:hypothetical protein
MQHTFTHSKSAKEPFLCWKFGTNGNQILLICKEPSPKQRVTFEPIHVRHIKVWVHSPLWLTEVFHCNILTLKRYVNCLLPHKNNSETAIFPSQILSTNNAWMLTGLLYSCYFYDFKCNLKEQFTSPSDCRQWAEGFLLSEHQSQLRRKPTIDA